VGTDERSAAESRPARILVVDDEPLIAQLLAESLSLEGYEVDTAKNGREALEKIATCSYEVILSDLRMPELDGVGLYRALHEQQPHVLPRLAFVSGTTEPPEYATFLAETRVPVLSKPFALAVLHQLVQRLLHEEVSRNPESRLLETEERDA